jgi:hypothetical protein
MHPVPGVAFGMKIEVASVSSQSLALRTGGTEIEVGRSAVRPRGLPQDNQSLASLADEIDINFQRVAFMTSATLQFIGEKRKIEK